MTGSGPWQRTGSARGSCKNWRSGGEADSLLNKVVIVDPAELQADARRPRAGDRKLLALDNPDSTTGGSELIMRGPERRPSAPAVV